MTKAIRHGCAAALVLWLVAGGRAMAEGPSWWTNGSPAVLTTNAANDYGAVNMGQLKWIATNAAAELDANLPGGRGTNLYNLLNAWLPGSNNYAAVNVGQLKYLGSNVWHRLIEEGCTNALPWTNSPTVSDFAAANIGQVKNLFSFDLRVDSDSDGMPDWWETANGLNPANPADASLDADGDWLSNLAEYQQRTNPRNADSDGDGVPDGWSNFIARCSNDPDARVSVTNTGRFGDTNGSYKSEYYVLHVLPLGETNTAKDIASWTNPTTNVMTGFTNAISLGTGVTFNLRWWKHAQDSRNVLYDHDYEWYMDGVPTNSTLGWAWLARCAIDQTRTNGSVYSHYTNSTPVTNLNGRSHLGNHYVDAATQDLDFGGQRAQPPVTNDAPGKRVDVYVPVVDLDGDVDRNGVTNDCDAVMEGVAPGAVLSGNNDDDNTNGVPDCQETGTVTGENDLYHVRFIRGPESMPTGTVTLAIVSGTNCIRVWTSPTKGATNLLLSSTCTSTNWVLTSTNSWSTIPTNLWIEGMTNSTTSGDIALAARFSGPTNVLCADTNVFTVLKVDLLQAGFDATVPSQRITLRKTAADWRTDTFQSTGTVVVANPVWQDTNSDDYAEVSDPVCATTGAVLRVAGGGMTRLKITPAIGTMTIAAKIKVDASPIGASGQANDQLFGPEDVCLTGNTVDVSEIVESTGTNVAPCVNRFYYHMKWSCSVDNGVTWWVFQEMDQDMLVTFAEAENDYCNKLNSWDLPYLMTNLTTTAKRMEWACRMGAFASDESLLCNFVQSQFALQFSTNSYNDPFVQLDVAETEMGDCISLANLAATALRLLGVNARPARAFCVPTVDSSEARSWGWERCFTNMFHNDWFPIWDGNKFEGFFYIGDENPLGNSSFPSLAWTADQNQVDTGLPPEKAKYVPIDILSQVVGPPRQLYWYDGSTYRPDLAWKSGSQVSGVTFVSPCTTWSSNPSQDGEYAVDYVAVPASLTLGDGSSVAVPTTGTYLLTCSKGSISVTVTNSSLPSTNVTGMAQIAPARNLGSVPP